MKVPFGEIRQLGFISRDIDRSMNYFLDTWNMGPWYVMRHLKSPILHKGEPSELDLSIAMSNCGDLQFEIIQQHNDAPSVYRDALNTVPFGLHVQHMAVWTDDFDKTKAEALVRGWTLVLETTPGPGEACYVAHLSEPGVCLEISDRSSWKEHARNTIRDIALNWNGEDPIREGLPK